MAVSCAGTGPAFARWRTAYAERDNAAAGSAEFSTWHPVRRRKRHALLTGTGTRRPATKASAVRAVTAVAPSDDGRVQSADTGRRLRHAPAPADAEPAETARRVRQQAHDTPSDRSSGHGRRARGKHSGGRRSSSSKTSSAFAEKPDVFARDFRPPPSYVRVMQRKITPFVMFHDRSTSARFPYKSYRRVLDSIH